MIFVFNLLIVVHVLGQTENENQISDSGILLQVLGTVQDAGMPQLGCQKDCCSTLTVSEKAQRLVSSLALQIPGGSTYLFDASLDLPHQWQNLQAKGTPVLSGIFLTHAHMGHYAGMLHLGREAWNTTNIPVYTMPRMQAFIENNAPWEQLLTLNNIQLKSLVDQQPITLAPQLQVTPILVPHRDEYSETVAFWIQGPNKSALYLPDIDKWERWATPIESWLAKVDYAFLDATFYNGNELPNRAMDEIPHPFVVESLARFKALPLRERAKIYFIHLNHTNPLLREDSPERKKVEAEGFFVAQAGRQFAL